MTPPRWACSIAAALLCGLLAAPPRAAAEPIFEAPEPDAFDFSWDSELDAKPSEYEEAMTVGDAYALRAARWLDRRAVRAIAERESLATRAVEAYERAAKADPTRAEPHYRAAEILHAHFLDSNIDMSIGFSRSHAPLAIHHWEEFQRLAPRDPRLLRVLFRRSIVHTKLATDEDFAQALADLELLLDLRDLSDASPDNAATWLGNSAEMYMLLGRLDEAIATYERALELSKSVSHALGLAVALDRHGQRAKAREVAKLFISEGTFNKFIHDLRNGNVFYEPDGEEYYYLALAHEVLGLLSQARALYLDFILSGANPRFQERARANVADLTKQIEARKKGGWSSRAGRPRGQ